MATTKEKSEKSYRVQDDGGELRRPSLEGAVEKWLAARELAAQAAKDEKLAAEALKAAFGRASFIRAGRFVISYKLVEREAYWVSATRYRQLRLVEEE